MAVDISRQRPRNALLLPSTESSKMICGERIYNLRVVLRTPFFLQTIEFLDASFISFGSYDIKYL